MLCLNLELVFPFVGSCYWLPCPGVHRFVLLIENFISANWEQIVILGVIGIRKIAVIFKYYS
jgi:hypothetical protein